MPQRQDDGEAEQEAHPIRGQQPGKWGLHQDLPQGQTLLEIQDFQRQVQKSGKLCRATFKRVFIFQSKVKSGGEEFEGGDDHRAAVRARHPAFQHGESPALT